MLEQRIQGLEYEVGGLRRDISATRADLAELKGKVSMLPGYPGIAVIVTIIGGLLAIAQYLVGSGAAGP
ncbi:MAG: hypothetical protein H3C51_02385 [Rubellimicrobium sp.]|nr:hypothetical protein [Rubellimicrobium sp.]